jgi:hypothetical protein
VLTHPNEPGAQEHQEVEEEQDGVHNLHDHTHPDVVMAVDGVHEGAATPPKHGVGHIQCPKQADGHAVGGVAGWEGQSPVFDLLALFVLAVCDFKGVEHASTLRCGWVAAVHEVWAEPACVRFGDLCDA